MRVNQSARVLSGRVKMGAATNAALGTQNPITKPQHFIMQEEIKFLIVCVQGTSVTILSASISRLFATSAMRIGEDAVLRFC